MTESTKCKTYKTEAVFCLRSTTPRTKRRSRMNCCVSGRLIPQWQQTHLCYSDSTFLSFQPSVCIFQHDWRPCEWNPRSTTLTQWTLLIQVHSHRFLAAPFGSDLPPVGVKRDANRKSFSHLTDSLFLSIITLSFCSPAWVLSFCTDSARTPCSENHRKSWLLLQWTSLSCEVYRWSETCDGYTSDVMIVWKMKPFDI